MNYFNFTTLINTLANAIALNISSEETALLAAVLVQLGDTLATISIQKNLNPPSETR